MNAELLKDILIRKLGKDEDVPYELLLDADPSYDNISEYLGSSEIYIALLDDKVVGTYVLFPLSSDAIEIKNIAVDDKLQGNGMGKLLLNNAMQMAINKGIRTMVIGTSNSSIVQLYLYQKQGFEITGIKPNFFLDNYPEPIVENGIQCKHMLILTKQLFA